MHKPRTDNPLSEVISTIKFLWRHRGPLFGIDRVRLGRKEFYLDNRIPGLILDVFDNLGYVTRDNRKPVLQMKKKTDYGWYLVFDLPPGISFKKVLRNKDYFQDACNSWINMKWYNGKLHMEIYDNSLPEKIPFRWNAEEYSTFNLPIPIGYNRQGLEVLDLPESPHLLVAGVPGFGKSNFLHGLIHSVIQSAVVVVVDLKRLEFAYLKDYCTLAQDEKEARDVLKALNDEMEKRFDVLIKKGLVKIQEYEGDDMPYIVLVIDELAELKEDKALYLLDRLVRLTRAVGISVVASTQRPSTKVIDGDTRAMFAARLCFKVADEISSRIVLGENCPSAAYLPAVKGRAIYKFGIEECEVQTMYLPLSRAKKMLEKIPKRRWDYKPSSKRLPPR